MTTRISVSPTSHHLLIKRTDPDGNAVETLLSPLRDGGQATFEYWISGATVFSVEEWTPPVAVPDTPSAA